MKRVYGAAAVLAFAAGGHLQSTLSQASTGLFSRKSLPQGRTVGLEAFLGKVVLLDFWATWCKPCQDELPAFERLQARFGTRGLAVVPVSLDLKGLPAPDSLYKRLEIRNLPKYVDDTRESAKALGLRALPSTLLIDREGREIQRVEGPANWQIGESLALIDMLLDE